MSTHITRKQNHLNLFVATGVALLLCTAAQATEVKPQPAAASKAQGAKPKAKAAKDVNCVAAAGSLGNSGDGSNNAGSIKPMGPRCPPELTIKKSAPSQ